MSKKKEQVQTKNLFQYVNEFIESLNKVSLLIIFILYASILGIILNAIPNIKQETYSNPYISDYAHLTYNEDTGTLFKIVYEYELDENKEITSTIDLNVYMNTFSGKRTISRQFMPKALLQNGKMHFFTQYDNYEEVMHNMRIPSDPKALFVAMDYYDKDGYHKYYTLREDVLTLTKNELSLYQDEYDNTNVTIYFTKTQENERTYYDFKVQLRNTSNEFSYHVDVQSWAVNDKEEIYPYVGFYNYTNVEKNTMSDKRVAIPDELNIKYIYIKVKYYSSDNKFTNNINTSQEILYKIPISE